ncbi:hypothetical protein AFB00_02165 [Pseudonocardia sp. HH130630-07]|nr:hypothetical protein AFB00_02165 [Pseudonocardia sp. HH130630-07]
MPPAPPHYRRVSHGVHLFLTLFTFGMWAVLVWWWWTIVINVSNNSARADFEAASARFEYDRWQWEQYWRRLRGEGPWGPPPGPGHGPQW